MAVDRPADPVVSPADTIRRARTSAKAMPWPASQRVEELADLAVALLAVGERDRRQIAQLTADFNELRLWTAQHIGALDLEDVDGDVAQVLSSLDSIVLGNAGCTEESDYTPEQWRVLQLCAVLAGEEDAANG